METNDLKDQIKMTICQTCQNNQNLEGYPDPDCAECKGTGKTPHSQTEPDLPAGWGTLDDGERQNANGMFMEYVSVPKSQYLALEQRVAQYEEWLRMIEIGIGDLPYFAKQALDGDELKSPLSQDK